MEPMGYLPRETLGKPKVFHMPCALCRAGQPTSTESHRFCAEKGQTEAPKLPLCRYGTKAVSAPVRKLGKGVVDSVVFSERDIDLLRILRWCRCIFREDAVRYFSEDIVSNLTALSYLKLYQESGALILTAGGNRFLESVFSDLPSGIPLAYREPDTRRRLRLSKLVLTTYRAGLNIFTTPPEELIPAPALFLPAIMRGRGRNPWGNPRTAAIVHLEGLSCAVHFVCPGIGKLMLMDELNAFANNTGALKDVRQSIVFAGSSYPEILSELEQLDNSGESRLITYGEAYRQMTMPVHLLSCDDTGAKQQRIMNVPDYRKKFSMAALKAHYEPPPKNAPAWDALYGDIPFVMAADMNLRRVDAAITTAQERGYSQIALAALEEQAEAVFFTRYRDAGLARVFTLTDAALSELDCDAVSLHSPSRRQFLTAKGDVVDAPLIQTHRKTGRKG